MQKYSELHEYQQLDLKVTCCLNFSVDGQRLKSPFKHVWLIQSSLSRKSHKDTAKTLLTPKSYASKQKSWFICASLTCFTIPFSESHCTFVLFVLSLLYLTYKYYNTLHWIPLHSGMHRYWHHSHRMYCLRMCGSRSRRCPEKVTQEQWKLNTLLTAKN